VTIVVLVILTKILRQLFSLNCALYRLDEQLECFVSPAMLNRLFLGINNACVCLLSFAWFIDLKAQFVLKVLLHLVVGDTAIEVVVHGLH
jgi:hypothetical protein